MGVGDNTYGTVARVEALVGDVVTSRTFGTGTTPKLAQVEIWLDDIASEIHAVLSENGYPVKTSAWVTANAPRVANYLAMLNTNGAAALVLQSLPYEAQAPEIADAPPSRGNWLWKRYKDGLEKLSGSFLQTLGLSRSVSMASNFRSGSYTDEDGREKLPLFSRGMTDMPAARELTE